MKRLPLRMIIENAYERGYLAFERDPDYRLRNAWWDYCAAKGCPYIWARLGKVEDQIDMDLLIDSRRPGKDAIERVLSIYDAKIQAERPFRSKRQKRWIHGYYGDVVTSMKLPHPYGQGLAAALSALVFQHRRGAA